MTDVGREIYDKLAVNDEVVVGFLEIQCEHFCISSAGLSVLVSGYRRHATRRTMTAQFQINDICDSDVHDAEKPLVAFLEFALVKDLNGDDG